MGTDVLKCWDISELSTDYTERTLPTGRRLAVGLHLLMCQMCRTYMNQLSRTRRLLADRPLTPAAGVEERVIASLNGDKAGP
jgi:predicted anti-sigma-YlaC factor YlaD